MAFTTELDELLAEGAQPITRRPPAKPDVLFGAGLLGRSVLAGLRKAGVEPRAFADDTVSKQGTEVDGLPVMRPEQAASQFGATDWVVTILNPEHRYLDSKRRLRGLGCRRVKSFLEVSLDYPETLLPYYQFDLPDRVVSNPERLKTAFALFDERSQRQFLDHLRFRLWLDHSALPPTSPDQYFSSDILPTLTSDITFVDCGAFTGNTLKRFLTWQSNEFRRVVAIEPDRQNFEKLSANVHRMSVQVASRIELHNIALGSRDGTTKFNGLGNMVANVDAAGSEEVAMRSLDQLLQLEKPTYIKFDIEGGERDALVGCQRIMREVEPLMAVSVYHKPDDLWEIPLYIHSINPSYRFHLSTEGTDGMDLICYAVPPTMGAA
ncbi:MAG: FkbM family methyltransferase [Gemmataceae bacterium]